jgi:hypothetical protein
MLSMYCMARMLPCGRYYYDPEGGYVGNPWVKFSYQYSYLYLAWFIHHFDVIEHYGFQYSQTFVKRSMVLYSGAFKRSKKLKFQLAPYKSNQKSSQTRFTDKSYNFWV